MSCLLVRPEIAPSRVRLGCGEFLTIPGRLCGLMWSGSQWLPWEEGGRAEATSHLPAWGLPRLWEHWLTAWQEVARSLSQAGSLRSKNSAKSPVGLALTGRPCQASSWTPVPGGSHRAPCLPLISGDLVLPKGPRHARLPHLFHRSTFPVLPFGGGRADTGLPRMGVGWSPDGSRARGD